MSEERLIVVAAEDACGLDGEVSTRFEQCPFFVLAEADGYLVTVSRVVPNPHFGAHRTGMMPRFIRDLGANVIIAGGMAPRNLEMFRGFGIDVAIGTIGTVEKLLGAYLCGIHHGVISGSGCHPDSRDGSRPLRADRR